MDWQGKTAFITGGVSGIGFGIARAFAEAGIRLILSYRNEAYREEAESWFVKNELELPRFVKLDVTDRARFAEVAAEVGKVHILVNNTGGPPAGPIVEAAGEAFLRAYHNHLICNQLLAQAVLPGMKGAGFGRIINIISTSVKEPLDNLGVSNSTRWAVAGWAKTWANEVGQFGITVNNVLPGYTRTGRLEEIIGKRAAATGSAREVVEEQFKNHVPARRFAEPSEIAAAAAFLASPAAAYINGINLPVDGGRTRSL